MSGSAKDMDSPLSDKAQEALINSATTDDEDSKQNNNNKNNNTSDKSNNENNDNDNKENWNEDDDLDPNEVPKMNIDKRASNFIKRRHSADLKKDINSKFQIKITGPSDSSNNNNNDVTINMDDIKTKEKLDKDSVYFEGSDDEDGALKMLGEPQEIVKTQSLDTGLSNRKENESFKLNDELQNLSAKQASIVKIERTDSISGKKIVDTAVVPARDVIERYPFFSTPLTVESTNNAFRDFMARLTEMGFRDQAEAALVLTNAESVEAAVQYITDNVDALWHRFELPNDMLQSSKHSLLTDTTTDNNTTNSNNDDKNRDLDSEITDFTLCNACGMAYVEHLIDHRGEQIVSKSDRDENNNTSLFGDLQGRTSMSVATLKERQDALTLQEQIKQRVHVLNSLSELNNNNNDNKDDNEENEDKLAMGNDEIKTDGKITLSKDGKKIEISEKMKKEIDNVLKEEAEKMNNIQGPTETCLICFSDKSVDDFYRAPCGHNYCKECLQEHYKVKTKDGDVLKVACIDPKCDREIPEEECRQFLTDPEILAKYEKFRRDKLIMLNPNARFCPKPDCSGFMTGSRWNPKLTCPVCSEDVCFNCSQHWHGYFVGCNQNVDIGYSRWAINKDVQKCPKCRIRIEKSEGCNHMTCQSCHYEFCWICRGHYTSSHFDPWNIFGCPGAQFTPRFCRFPSFFPRWLNRILVLICFFSIIVPLVIVAGTLWLVVLFLVFCVRCDAKCDIDPCDCFD